MEFFLDNYKTPSLNQTAKNVLLNYDVNEALYITVIDALLTEGYLTNKIASGIIKTTNPIKSRNITKLYNKTEKYLQKGQNVLAKNKLPTSNFIGNAYRKGKAEKYLQKAMTLNQKHADLTKEIDTKKSALQNKLDNSLIGKGINSVESGVKGVINTSKKIINAPKNLMTKLATATGKVLAF